MCECMFGLSLDKWKLCSSASSAVHTAWDTFLGPEHEQAQCSSVQANRSSNMQTGQGKGRIITHIRISSHPAHHLPWFCWVFCWCNWRGQLSREIWRSTLHNEPHRKLLTHRTGQSWRCLRGKMNQWTMKMVLKAQDTQLSMLAQQLCWNCWKLCGEKGHRGGKHSRRWWCGWRRTMDCYKRIEGRRTNDICQRLDKLCKTWLGFGLKDSEGRSRLRDVGRTIKQGRRAEENTRSLRN